MKKFIIGIIITLCFCFTPSVAWAVETVDMNSAWAEGDLTLVANWNNLNHTNENIIYSLADNERDAIVPYCGQPVLSGIDNLFTRPTNENAVYTLYYKGVELYWMKQFSTNTNKPTHANGHVKVNKINAASTKLTMPDGTVVQFTGSVTLEDGTYPQYYVVPAEVQLILEPAQKFEGEEDPEYDYTMSGVLYEPDVPKINFNFSREEGETPGVYTTKIIPTSTSQLSGDYLVYGSESSLTILAIPKVVVNYFVGNENVKTVGPTTESINLNEEAPQVNNLAYWSYQTISDYNPVVSPIEGKDLNTVNVYAVLNGAAGAQGEQGPQGEQGQQGEIGPQGEKGDKGDTGDKGDVGEKGDKGNAGEKGEKGDPGVNGKDGKNGKDGEKGATGPQGARGPQGPAGTSKISNINNNSVYGQGTPICSHNSYNSHYQPPQTGDSLLTIIFPIIIILLFAIGIGGFIWHKIKGE